jgi:hypothetical protein
MVDAAAGGSNSVNLIIREERFEKHNMKLNWRKTMLRCGMIRIAAVVSLLLVSYIDHAAAQQFNTKFKISYCTDSSFPAQCTKTVTIYNNSDHPIYPVIQATLEQGAGKEIATCPHGDTWLQAAFGDIANCYATAYNYLIYVNGTAGILEHKHASINLPWWSKRAQTNGNPNTDVYIDWWRAARIYIFDDPGAVKDSYTIDKARSVQFTSRSPMVSCVKTDPESVCQSTIAYQTCVAGTTRNGVKTACLPGTNAIKSETPQQLNEYTLASVDPILGLTNFNENYNVSNVDQVYLPIAIEPMINADRRENNRGNTPGYLGTTLSVQVLRQRLMAFTGATGSPDNPQKPTRWPIYTVPKNPHTGALLYPMAGIRVPGAANVFNFLAQPAGKELTPNPHCAAPGCIPTEGNSKWSGTTLVDGMITQWLTCTVSPTATNCPQSGLYGTINQTFQTNYIQYYARCASNFPAWLAPAPGTKLPNLYAFLQFVYGWVPFNVACGGIDLPTGEIPREYIRLQDNFRQIRGTPPATGQKIFNPYAQLIHGAPDGNPKVPFGLAAAAYAYSIDDQSSFLSEPGVGLIFAVGGGNGLPNPDQYIFPPPLDPEKDIQVILGDPLGFKPARALWQAYQICAKDPTAAPSVRFRHPSLTDAGGGQRFGVPTDDTRIWRNPCYLTISDAANKVYQIKLTKSVPWPAFNNVTNKGGFDHQLMTCPTPDVPGYTPVAGNANDPNNWCGATNEVANPAATPTNALRYELDLRPPNE